MHLRILSLICLLIAISSFSINAQKLDFQDILRISKMTSESQVVSFLKQKGFTPQNDDRRLAVFGFNMHKKSDDTYAQVKFEGSTFKRFEYRLKSNQQHALKLLDEVMKHPDFFTDASGENWSGYKIFFTNDVIGICFDEFDGLAGKPYYSITVLPMIEYVQEVSSFKASLTL